jgi:2-polyprenyl-3-methyl-5-hydroxy-6-metoxy-1,4-benzoquinol methylase
MDSSFAQQAHCPVCQSLCPDPPLYQYKVSEASAHFCPSTRDAERNSRLQACIRRLWQGEECSILRCRECGFAFGHPFVGGDEEFYSILHEQKGYPAWRWDYDVALDAALKAKDGGRILEIGAGVGNFLKSLDQKWQRFAVEASESNRAELEKAGIKVFRDLNAAVLAESGSFEVIVLFQVLEHIAEFKSVLVQCRKLLGESGRLVLTVPDGDAMIRQERLTGCPDMPPNHINKFTPQSLSRALRDAGFEPGPAIPEPSSLRNLQASLYMRVTTDATRKHSLAAQVYRIRNKRLRQPFLVLLGVPALLRMLPHVGQLQAGGAFAITARPV